MANYYISSILWSTLSKVLNAICGFISVPLLLGYYGKADYGILSLATACNAYMHILDLGINSGSVRFFSIWKKEGKVEAIYKAARTNISFYIIIAIINSILLVSLGIWGEHIFSITHDQFVQLRECLFILAFFSVFNWVSTVFNQLLVSDKQLDFTMKLQSILPILKVALIICVLWLHIPLSVYFFCLSFIIAFLIIPYAIKCRRDNLINSFKPAFYWKDFSPILTFSLSLFALSIIQVTASQSRPIILGLFATDGASAITDFKVVEVIPTFIMSICGTFSSIFLPNASELVAGNNYKEIESFAYRWTMRTSIISNLLCIPFILCAQEVLIAYVGQEYKGLSVWLVIWLLTTLIKSHTTPGYSLILAYGKTKILLITSGIACALSIFLNISLAKHYGAGSAIIGYGVYVLIVVSLYYLVYYNKMLNLSRIKMLKSFIQPTFLALIAAGIIAWIPFNNIMINWIGERLNLIIRCIIKTFIWLVPYSILLLVTHAIGKEEIKIATKR